MKKAVKHPEDMSAGELAEATKEFAKPYAFEKARPMTAAERVEERVLRGGRNSAIGLRNTLRLDVMM